MKYKVGDEVFIKGRIISIGTNNPHDEYPNIFYQVDIGEIGAIVISEKKVVDMTKLVKPCKNIDAKEYKKGHFR